MKAEAETCWVKIKEIYVLRPFSRVQFIYYIQGRSQNKIVKRGREKSNCLSLYAICLRIKLVYILWFRS